MHIPDSTWVAAVRSQSGESVCVVYPEGVWYRAVGEAVLERVLQEHVLGGQVVEEHVIARAPWRRTPRSGSGRASPAGTEHPGPTRDPRVILLV